MSRRDLPLSPPPRTCGSCNACCSYASLEAFEKQRGDLCHHAGAHSGGSGCSIYSERPGECVDYRCLWLDGEFELEDRPDLSGLAFDLPTRVKEHPDYEGLLVICARETAPRSRDGVRATDLLRRLSRQMVVRLTTFAGPTELRGHRAQLALLVERARVRDLGPSSGLAGSA